LLNTHRDALDAAEALIIDLRGNEGGGSQTTAALHPYVVGADSLDPRADFGAPVMLASPDQISYAKRAFGVDTSAFVRRIVAAMEAAPGTLVPLFDPTQPRQDTGYPPPRFGPRRVLMLIDGGTVSAAEVIVQLALRSNRTIVIGEPTAGALDYQSANIVRIHPEETRWLLGYPTITAHARLPEGGMRGKGLAPEVALQWGGVTDPVEAALRAK
jgi:C-terminal processing protease CtpA/Prc